MSQLEKVNTTMEGIEVLSVPYNTNDGRRVMSSSMTTLILPDLRAFLSNEEDIARESLWDNVMFLLSTTIISR